MGAAPTEPQNTRPYGHYCSTAQTHRYNPFPPHSPIAMCGCTSIISHVHCCNMYPCRHPPPLNHAGAIPHTPPHSLTSHVWTLLSLSSWCCVTLPDLSELEARSASWKREGEPETHAAVAARVMEGVVTRQKPGGCNVTPCRQHVTHGPPVGQPCTWDHQ